MARHGEVKVSITGDATPLRRELRETEARIAQFNRTARLRGVSKWPLAAAAAAGAFAGELFTQLVF